MKQQVYPEHVANILLVNPNFPRIHQNYDYILPVTEAKFIAPPLSLLTISALIPHEYKLKLIDLNVSPLKDEDILWADAIFMTGIIAQAESMMQIAIRCKKQSKNILLIIGGLYISVYEEKFLPYADAIVQGEAETIIAPLIEDMKAGKLKKRYTILPEHVDMRLSPCPRFDLINFSDYLIWTLQYSRGCPYNCEFCGLTYFYGNKCRAKTIEQFIAELDAVYKTGFRGVIMLGDDNFHHAPQVRELLEAIAEWQKRKNYPFMFFTQTDITIAKETEQINLMTKAGFTSLQIGIESPAISSLKSMNKVHNTGLDLLNAIHTIHKHGLEVQSAMLVGVDGDPENIADIQFEFLQNAGTPRCMISILRPYRSTKLYDRLAKEGRIFEPEPSGNQTDDFVLNYITRIGNDKLLSDIVKLVRNLYKPSNYFKRCWKCLKNLNTQHRKKHPISSRSLRIFWNYWKYCKAFEYNRHFVLFLLKVLFSMPEKISLAAGFGILGYHYYMMSQRAEVNKRESIEDSGKFFSNENNTEHF